MKVIRCNFPILQMWKHRDRGEAVTRPKPSNILEGRSSSSLRHLGPPDFTSFPKGTTRGTALALYSRPPPPALQSSLSQPLLLRHFSSCLMRANFQEPCPHQWEECGAPELPRRLVEVEIPQGRNAHLVSHKFNENGTKIQVRLLQ